MQVYTIHGCHGEVSSFQPGLCIVNVIYTTVGVAYINYGCTWVYNRGPDFEWKYLGLSVWHNARTRNCRSSVIVLVINDRRHEVKEVGLSCSHFGTCVPVFSFSWEVSCLLGSHLISERTGFRKWNSLDVRALHIMAYQLETFGQLQTCKIYIYTAATTESPSSKFIVILGTSCRLTSTDQHKRCGYNHSVCVDQI